MVLCLHLPVHLPSMSKYLYSQCRRYLMRSNLRSFNKKIGRRKFSLTQQVFVEKQGTAAKTQKIGNKKLEELFENVAQKVCGPYLALLTDLTGDIPTPPSIWKFTAGWTCYSPSGTVSVDYPDEDALVFDVEVCVREGFYPTLAAAVSRKAWYFWVSPRLIKSLNGIEQSAFTLDDLIPMGNSPTSRIIVGHYVAYDRARIREEYSLEGTGMRFFDTLSAHVCVSGVTNAQRNLMFSSLPKNEKWYKLTSPNSLVHVSEFYCGVSLNKVKRDTFVNGSLSDIVKDFQLLSNYCAEDVIATHKVFCKLLPLFLDRHPHLISLAGMLELSTPFLPVSQTWKRRVSEAKGLAGVLKKTQLRLLSERAEECLPLAAEELYKYDPWMWDLNWELERLNTTKCPSWYKVFYLGLMKTLAKQDLTGSVYYGLFIPKILRLRCGPFPLHYLPRLGWGVLVPEDMFIGRVMSYLEDALPLAPVKQIKQVCQEPYDDVCSMRMQEVPSLLEALEDDLYWRELPFRKSAPQVETPNSEATESVHELLISEKTIFRRLHNVGGPRAVRNPLGKTMSKGLMALNSREPKGREFLDIRDRLLPWATHSSLWTEQNVVWQSTEQGVILPQVDVCADYLRLPRDRAWTPLISLLPNQVGAGLLKSVAVPPGHLFISVCFDNLDLWFASLFGDAVKGRRGSTKFSAYFLSGVLFEKMASSLTISLEEAKCFCHAVIAGADTYMLSKLICQTRVNISREGALQLAYQVMDLLVDYELLIASPSELWPHIDADELRSPLLGSRLSRPLELEKNRVRLRAQWLIHSSKADFLHLFITYHRSVKPDSRLCFVYGDVRCLYLVSDEYLMEESFSLTHQAVQLFCLARFGLPAHRNDPSSSLTWKVSRNLSALNEKSRMSNEASEC